ncbi:hypothetical protein AB0D87_49765 [Streptomyces sp. NPDC048342]|uniref:hypothetical protein n=1 Tax=unclassified Streptomyces TaxID=2593676 RepID=UPI003435E38F
MRSPHDDLGEPRPPKITEECSLDLRHVRDRALREGGSKHRTAGLPPPWLASATS